MVVYPDQVVHSTWSDMAKSWPVAGWYLVDEPDVQKWPAEKLAEVEKQVKAWSPRQSTTFVIGESSPSTKYGHIGDILMLDWYPVPHLPLASIGDHIAYARQNIPEGKPLWAVVQAFDWRDSKQRDPKKPRIGRFPTHHEIRFMSYDSIINGATGIFFYRLSKPGGRTLFDVPEEFQAVTRVVRELKSIKPILERGRPLPLPVKLEDEGLQAKAWRHRGRDFIILVNRSSVPRAVPDELLAPRWRPFFELRRDPREALLEHDDAWHLRPFQVLVLQSRLWPFG